MTTNFDSSVSQVLDSIKEMLLEKNRKYGDSALNPIRVFSTADSTEQIKVRIDDKLSRIRSGQSDDIEDVIDDLIGYLVLLKISQRKEENLKDGISHQSFYVMHTFKVKHNETI